MNLSHMKLGMGACFSFGHPLLRSGRWYNLWAGRGQRTDEACMRTDGWV
jgi:hypothetical protein